MAPYMDTTATSTFWQGMKFVTALQKSDAEAQEWTLQEFDERLASARPGKFTVFELLEGNERCKPFFDFDKYLGQYEDPAPYEQDFVKNVASLFEDHPAFSADQVAVAQRHRWIKDRYKISVRAYVEGYIVTPLELKALIIEKGKSHVFDMAVYRKSGKLGVLGGNKDSTDVKPLTAITHVGHSGAFLAQHLTGLEQVITQPLDRPPQASQIGAMEGMVDGLAIITPPQSDTFMDESVHALQSTLKVTVTKTYPLKDMDGFGFDIIERQKPCFICGGKHDHNHWTCENILLPCVALGNFSTSCFTRVIGLYTHPILTYIHEIPNGEDGYVQLYDAKKRHDRRRILYDGKRFIQHDGKLWSECHMLDVKREIKTTCQDVLALLILNLHRAITPYVTRNDDEAKTTKKKLEESIAAYGKGRAHLSRNNALNNITELASSLLHDKRIPKVMDMNIDLAGCHDGVLHLRTGELTYDPESYVSMSVDAGWRGLEHPTPKVDQFFTDVLGGPDEVSYMQKLLGYGLTGHVDNDIMLVFWGVGSNGKSATVKLIRETVGMQYAGTMSRDCVVKSTRPVAAGSASPHLVALEKLRIAICEETEENQMGDVRLDDGTIKLMTGGNRIVVRPLYKEQHEFMPTHLPILVTNHLPSFSADDEAMARRLLLIPFNFRFKPPHLYDENDGDETTKRGDPAVREWVGTEEAREEMLVWMVRGAMRWYSEGMGEPPLRFRQATEEFMRENDAVGNFMREQCVLGRDKDVETKALLDAYNEANPERKLTSKVLKRKMLNRGYAVKHYNTLARKGYFYKGIALTT